MKFLTNILRKKSEPIQSYADFWNWFQKHEGSFHKVVKRKGNIEKAFFDKLAPRLNELKEGFFYLTGMYDDHTVELVLTADGTVKNFVFVEELVEAAPRIDGWRFTALKPALQIEDVGIKMAGYTFSSDTMWFYPTTHADYPDEIDITIVHKSLKEKNKDTITNGVYIFLDNYLGELEFATTIDNVTVIGKAEAQDELIPISKLKDYLIWRQKEFIEKYEGVRHDTDSDTYSMLEAELESGNKLLAVINTDLLEWDAKASHPWVMAVEIKYDGKNNHGMPDEKTYQLLNEIEDEILAELKDVNGYLNIGRQTADGVREIFFTCKEFRKPSQVIHQIKLKYTNLIEISYDIYKDKYWMSFNRFRR